MNKRTSTWDLMSNASACYPAKKAVGHLSIKQAWETVTTGAWIYFVVHVLASNGFVPADYPDKVHKAIYGKDKGKGCPADRARAAVSYKTVRKGITAYADKCGIEI